MTERTQLKWYLLIQGYDNDEQDPEEARRAGLTKIQLRAKDFAGAHFEAQKLWDQAASRPYRGRDGNVYPAGARLVSTVDLDWRVPDAAEVAPLPDPQPAYPGRVYLVAVLREPISTIVQRLRIGPFDDASAYHPLDRYPDAISPEPVTVHLQVVPIADGVETHTQAVINDIIAHHAEPATLREMLSFAQQFPADARTRLNLIALGTTTARAADQIFPVLYGLNRYWNVTRKVVLNKTCAFLVRLGP